MIYIHCNAKHAIISLPLEKKPLKIIKKACSYYTKDYQFTPAYKLYVDTRGKKGWNGKSSLILKRKNEIAFPIGLVKRVVRRLNAKGYPTTIKDAFVPSRYSYDNILACFAEIKGVTLREYQVKALKACLKEGRGVLDLATNAGKTEIACALIQTLGFPKTLWLTGRSKLARDTRSRLIKRLGIPIGLVGSGEYQIENVTIGMPRSLISNPRAMEFVKTNQLLIVDESHHLGSKEYQEIVKQCDSAYRRIGLSGTPFKRQDNKNILIESLLGPTIYKVTNDQLIKLGYSAKPEIVLHEIHEPKLECRSWKEAYKRLVVHNAVRNMQIVELAIEAAEKGDKVFITVFEIEHGEILNEMLMNSFFTSYRFIHGKLDPILQDQYMKEFEYDNMNILIASPVMGEGIDFDVSVDRLIIADSKKAPISLIQKVGRVLRKGGRAVEIHDFADFTNDYLAKHSTARIKEYEKQSFQVRVFED